MGGKKDEGPGSGPGLLSTSTHTRSEDRAAEARLSGVRPARWSTREAAEQAEQRRSEVSGEQVHCNRD